MTKSDKLKKTPPEYTRAEHKRETTRTHKRENEKLKSPPTDYTRAAGIRAARKREAGRLNFGSRGLATPYSTPTPEHGGSGKLGPELSLEIAHKIEV